VIYTEWNKTCDWCGCWSCHRRCWSSPITMENAGDHGWVERGGRRQLDEWPKPPTDGGIYARVATFTPPKHPDLPITYA